MWMPDLAEFLAVIATGDFVFLALGAFVAGLVRGFSGFGTAMVYLPVAGQVLAPFEALTTLIIMDLIGPLPNMPRAWRDGAPRDVMRLGLGAAVALPIGVWILTIVTAELFRYGVSSITLLLLVLLIAGIRYHGELKRRMVYLAGALGGFLAGCAGLPGPPVIMLYMASQKPAQTIRANITMYLLVTDVLMLVVLSISDHLEASAVAIGFGVMLVYLVGNVLGGAIFRPGYERLYRSVAYGIIAISALSGLPLWD